MKSNSKIRTSKKGNYVNLHEYKFESPPLTREQESQLLLWAAVAKNAYIDVKDCFAKIQHMKSKINITSVANIVNTEQFVEHCLNGNFICYAPHDKFSLEIWELTVRNTYALNKDFINNGGNFRAMMTAEEFIKSYHRGEIICETPYDYSDFFLFLGNEDDDMYTNDDNEVIRRIDDSISFQMPTGTVTTLGNDVWEISWAGKIEKDFQFGLLIGTDTPLFKKIDKVWAIYFNYEKGSWSMSVIASLKKRVKKRNQSQNIAKDVIN